MNRAVNRVGAEGGDGYFKWGHEFIRGAPFKIIHNNFDLLAETQESVKIIAYLAKMNLIIFYPADS